MRLSLTRRDCNSHILGRFNLEMDKLVREFITKYGTRARRKQYVMKDLRITIDGKNYTSSRALPTGRVFLHLPKEVLRMKWEEKLICSRGEGS